MSSFPIKLIDEIKKHPCLFIQDNSAFQDQDLRHKAWKAISQKLEVDVVILQISWQKLKERYRAILLARSRSDNWSLPQKPWKYEEPMKFMEYYLQPKGFSGMSESSIERLEEVSEIISTDGPLPEVVKELNKLEEQIISCAFQQERTNPSTSTSTGMEVIVCDETSSPDPNIKSIIHENLAAVESAIALQANKTPSGNIIKPPATEKETDLPETDEEEITVLHDDYQLGNQNETEITVLRDDYQNANRISSREAPSVLCDTFSAGSSQYSLPCQQQ